MLKVELIGNLGADAEIKDANGSKFVTMRIANTNRWTDDAGETHESTDWVDVTINNTESKVIPFLKGGVKVFVRGTAKLRVYSSQKDRCMKAGLTVMAQEIELCGGSSDEVPRDLIVPETGALVKVAKYYQTDFDTSKFKKEDQAFLMDKRGNQYVVVKGGWVAPVQVPGNEETTQNETA